ncbi:hypothetical protein [Spirosoma rhododendri]|uniref:Uncharacterized protein n=1 Tax=Spirosoma rhododendri TaxID=2728024 RepID=A0A7L5DHZ6_9BACT|nr:hypothetical protein [Spirosoma rhododendri]QJD77966.1 hypothetical protein HH216_05675 [Spirosoma rhododendri]
MKRTSLILLLASTMLATAVPVEAKVTTKESTVSASSIGRKRKGYKPRRGGLFNTGLFKKKNPCGCPNH